MFVVVSAVPAAWSCRRGKLSGPFPGPSQSEYLIQNTAFSVYYFFDEKWLKSPFSVLDYCHIFPAVH